MAKIINLVNDCQSLAIRSDKIIGFNHISGGKYEVFLDGGGSVVCNAGQYEYEQFIEGMKENLETK